MRKRLGVMRVLCRVHLSWSSEGGCQCSPMEVSGFHWKLFEPSCYISSVTLDDLNSLSDFCNMWKLQEPTASLAPASHTVAPVSVERDAYVPQARRNKVPLQVRAKPYA